jgi:hypothetical protein
LVILAGAGCTFTPPGAAPGPGDDPDPDPDPGPAASSICDRSDPSLRLCVDFEHPISDRSATGAAIDAREVAAMDREGEPAAWLSAASTLHIREASTLDLEGQLTLEMWIRPMGLPAAGTGFWMLDNNQQYAAAFTDAGTIRCVLGNRVVDSAPLPMPSDDRFHHVACAYDRTTLRVYVDGELSRCANVTIEIPTTGDDGLAIGANLSGTDAVPQYDDSFVGGLDDVRVWARSDVDVCAAAGRTGCRTSCEEL